VNPARHAAWLLLALLTLLAVLPPAHPEARLFSDGWGATSYVDPAACVTTGDDRAAAGTLRPKRPAQAQWPDRIALAARYLSWGLLVPVLALAAVCHPRGIRRHATAVVFGLLGAAPAFYQWPLSPLFVSLRQSIAGAVVERFPVTEHGLAWIDGATLLLWLVGAALILGGSTYAAIRAVAHLTGLQWRSLARQLWPLAAVTVLLGSTMDTALYLRAEGVYGDRAWAAARAALLLLALGATAAAGSRTILAMVTLPVLNRVAATLLWLVPLALVGINGWLVHFHWTSRFHV
jgi:hypothetical protein